MSPVSGVPCWLLHGNDEAATNTKLDWTVGPHRYVLLQLSFISNHGTLEGKSSRFYQSSETDEQGLSFNLINTLIKSKTYC